MQLDIFKNNLPKKPYCSNNLDTGLLIRNADLAAQMRYIQHNHMNSKLWLVYDIDREISPDMIDVAQPNLFIQNRKNCHAHLAYSLTVPVHLNESSSQKPIRFAGAIDCAYQQALGADRSYAGLIMKNPLNDHWRTYELRRDSYDLHELSEYVDLQPYADRRKSLDDYGLGRNCSLFENLRRWAYKQKRRHITKDTFQNAVLGQAEAYNAQFTAPLPYSEVKATALSISKWTWRYYENGGKSRGRDALKGAQLDLHDKQVLAAVITNRQRTETTDQAIKHALERLRAKDVKITQKLVAETANVSLITVKRRWKAIL